MPPACGPLAAADMVVLLPMQAMFVIHVSSSEDMSNTISARKHSSAISDTTYIMHMYLCTLPSR